MKRQNMNDQLKLLSHPVTHSKTIGSVMSCNQNKTREKQFENLDFLNLLNHLTIKTRKQK